MLVVVTPTATVATNRAGGDQPCQDQQEGQQVGQLSFCWLLVPGDAQFGGQQAQSGQHRDDPPGAGRGRGGAPGDAQRRQPDPPQRDAGRDRRRRDADGDEQDVGQVQGQVAGGEGLAGEGDVLQGRPDRGEPRRGRAPSVPRERRCLHGHV
jgi:hypothetical protein